MVNSPLKLLTDFKPFKDQRGTFQKIFRSDLLKQKYGFCEEWKESFISFSEPNVIRGLHFQLPPADHWKLVTCISGQILDVCVDIRKSSTFGKVESFILSESNGNALLIPPGFAHGFKTLSDERAGLLYFTTAEHDPKLDSGILWDSIGFDWKLENKKPVLSDRDAKFVKLCDFKSPF